mgnify:CR=1 FL=1
MKEGIRNMTIDSISQSEDKTWAYILDEFYMWLGSRRQKESYATFEEAVEAWRKSCQS